jgi:hypothetical protein
MCFCIHLMGTRTIKIACEIVRARARGRFEPSDTRERAMTHTGKQKKDDAVMRCSREREHRQNNAVLFAREMALIFFIRLLPLL